MFNINLIIPFQIIYLQIWHTRSNNKLNLYPFKQFFFSSETFPWKLFWEPQQTRMTVRLIPFHRIECLSVSISLASRKSLTNLFADLSSFYFYVFHVIPIHVILKLSQGIGIFKGGRDNFLCKLSFVLASQS